MADALGATSIELDIECKIIPCWLLSVEVYVRL
jgi:hypothetical protein